MTWYVDLAPCDYFGEEHAANLRAVGWLERARPFKSGVVERSVMDRLIALSKEPWSPCVSAGVHPCDLCHYFPEAFGRSNLFIPGSGCIYVCPDLLSHYMNAHAYEPPGEFCAAVLACPDMGTVQYREAILANGARSLIRSARK